MSDPRRTKEIARIHCAKRDLGLDDEMYRDLLERVAGVRSASELDDRGRRRVLDELSRLGGGKKKYPGRPHNMESKDAPLELRKIEALLTDAKLPWAYADGIAKQMFRVERVAWCTPPQLRAVLVALVKKSERAADIEARE